MEWQPIETAPRDGTVILAYWPSSSWGDGYTYIHPVVFYDGQWIHDWDRDEETTLDPTHWMPLPTPPQS